MVYRCAQSTGRDGDGNAFDLVSEQLRELGHEVIVANVRELRAISHSDRKKLSSGCHRCSLLKSKIFEGALLIHAVPLGAQLLCFNGTQPIHVSTSSGILLCCLRPWFNATIWFATHYTFSEGRSRLGILRHVNETQFFDKPLLRHSQT